MNDGGVVSTTEEGGDLIKGHGGVSFEDVHKDLSWPGNGAIALWSFD